MSANVVPLNYTAECIRGNAEWFEQFTKRIANNEIAAVTLVAVDKDGEAFAFKIVPLNAKTIRYIQIGQLHEAICELDQTLDEEHA